MIAFCFAHKLRNLFCAGTVILPLASFAVEQAQTDGKPPVPAQSPLTANPLAPPPVIITQPPAAFRPYLPPAGLTNLSFDSETKEYKAQPGEMVAKFMFQLMNISDTPVHILGVSASCGCTTAQLPPMPWIIKPGSKEELHATMQLAGKPPGEVTKVLTIQSTNGMKQLYVKAIIPQPVAAAVMTDRQKNMELAKADRQAVFKNDCANCHVVPVVGKMGKELYEKACGICHDSEHRATLVSDLHTLNHPTDANFWRVMTADGKQGTLMPAFSQEHGGPLSKEQIDSLVTYLTTDFAREKPTTQTILPPAPTPPASQPPHAIVQPPLPPGGVSGQANVVVLPPAQPEKK